MELEKKANYLWFSLRTVIIVIILITFFIGCSISSNSNSQDNDSGDESSIITADNIPQFVYMDYIELVKINRITKFRSSEGHDYSDSFESCRSMKHYYRPKDGVDPATIKVFAPVSGTVTQIIEEWAGSQIHITSSEYTNLSFIIFHVNLNNSINVNSLLSAGQLIGTHIGSETFSDIAVGFFDSDNNWKLISYFDVMSDVIFSNYQTRGVSSRNDLIISKEERDADPLSCIGETFIDSGNLESWVTLTD